MNGDGERQGPSFTFTQNLHKFKKRGWGVSSEVVKTLFNRSRALLFHKIKAELKITT